MKRLLKTSLAIVAVAALTQVASAIPVTTSYNLGDLMANNASIRIGDKLFAEWGFQTAVPGVSAYNVTITPVGTVAVGPDGSDFYGIKIQGPFAQINLGSKDFGLSYSVTADSPYLIHDIENSFDGGGTSGGFVKIDETVYSQGPGQGQVGHSTLLWNLTHDVEDPPGEWVSQGDILLFQGVSKVWVLKDIYVEAPLDGSASATIIIQRFSQTVPDGGWTLLLLGSAFTGLAVLRRKLG